MEDLRLDDDDDEDYDVSIDVVPLSPSTLWRCVAGSFTASRCRILSEWAREWTEFSGLSAASFGFWMAPQKESLQFVEDMFFVRVVGGDGTGLWCFVLQNR